MHEPANFACEPGDDPNRRIVLFNLPHVLEKVFSYLCSRDLGNCAMTCQLWSILAKTVNERRKDPAYFFKIGACGHNVVCLCITSDDNMDELSEDLKKLMLRPVSCITFMTSHLFAYPDLMPSAHFSEFPPKHPRRNSNESKRAYLNLIANHSVKRFLPETCAFSFIVSDGVVGTDPITKKCTEVECESGFAGYLLPSVPGVEVHHVPINRNTNLDNVAREHGPVKCILLFVTGRGAKMTNSLIESCTSVQENDKVAVGGAIVNHTNSYLGWAIVFTGPNVEAASVYIKPTEKVGVLTRKLKLFQNTGLLGNHCIGFMFACVGRGKGFYGSRNVESSVFRKLYPNVPLMGVFGNGEIASASLPNVPSEILRKEHFPEKHSYSMSYTTVFVLVSMKY